MKRIFNTVVCIFIGLGLLLPAAAFAREGDCGYEGGISSGEAPRKVSYDYQEVCFITGEPILFKGTLTLKKSLKQGNISATYTYNLKNTDKAATLTRTLVYETKVTKKDNGQTIEETALTGTPTESVKIGTATYALKSYDFTRSRIIDSKPAVDYYAGNIWGKKTYQMGAADSAKTITVEATGNFYGYDQYWGTTEVEAIDYVIQNDSKADKWGGTANVTLSSTTTKQIRFIKNQPDQISFDGGYVQSQYNDSILEYTAKLPEFDSGGVSTDKLLDFNDSLKIETFPVETRLPVPNLSQLRGHWAENDVKELYSLEVFKGDDAAFNPQQYMTRAEFAAAIVQTAREVPVDPALVPKTTGKTGTAATAAPSPFKDVTADNVYFTQINNAYKRGLISGRGNNAFDPGSYLTVADAIALFIRALGLESLAPNPGAVTTFKDNDLIPTYARNAAFVAQRIGLIKGDDRGYLNPNENLTKARAAALLNRFIGYMRDGIRKDYRERAVNY